MKRSRFGENRIIAILNSAKLPRKVLPENTKRAAARCSRRWRVPYRRRVTNGCMNDVQSSQPRIFINQILEKRSEGWAAQAAAHGESDLRAVARGTTQSHAFGICLIGE